MKELPIGWAGVELGDVASLIRGVSFPRSVRRATSATGHVACLRTANIQSSVTWDDLWFIPTGFVKNPQQYLHPGNVLISMANSLELVGKVAQIRSDEGLPAVPGAFIAAIRTLEAASIHPAFLFYQLQLPSVRQSIRQTASTTTNISNISAPAVLGTVLMIAPFSEQRRIIAEIDRLFSNVEAAQASLCAAQKKLSLYEASTLNRAFRSGHPLCRIGDIFEVYIGSTPSRSVPEYWGGGIPWVSSGEVAFCRVSATRETISPLGLANSSVKVHPAGTVLLGMIGEGKTRGQAAILDIEAGNNQNSAAIRVSEAGYPPEYLFWFLVSEYEKTRSIGSGNNQPALNKSRVKDIRFPLAPLPEQVKIVASLEQAMSVTSSLKQAVSGCLARAARLRQAILKTAFEGKLVPQDPNDEPASVLLDRIRATRAQTPARRAPRKREVHA